MREFTKSAGIVLLFILLAAIYFHDALSGENLLTERDLGPFFIPPRLFWVDAVKHSSFPFWNPYYQSGHPLFATLQPGVFYPFSLFFLFLPFAVVFNNTIILHFAMAGIFTYMLMRAQKASHGASFIAGVCFIFGGYFISVHNLLSTLLSVTWVPLFLLVYFSAFYKKQISMSVWSGAVGTVMFLGGGVEVCFLIFPLVFLLSLFPALLFEESQYPPLKNRISNFTVFVLSFAGLSAVQLLPFEELSRLSVRAKGFSYIDATIWSLSPADLATFFIPDLYGYNSMDPAITQVGAALTAANSTSTTGLLTATEKYWLNQSWLKSIYLGGASILLSLFFFKKRERKPQGFILLILLSLTLAFGRHSLFYPYIYKYVPLFNQLRYPVKFIFLAIFLICLGAGFGYDQFLAEARRGAPSRLAKAIFGAGFASMILFGLLNAYEEPIRSFCQSAGWDSPAYNDIHVNLFNARRVLCFTGVFSLLIYLGIRFGSPNAMPDASRELGNHSGMDGGRQSAALQGKDFFAYAVIFLLVLDLFFSNQGFYKKTKTSEYMKNSSNMDFIISDPSLFRIFVSKKTIEEHHALILPGQGDDALLKERIISGLGMNSKIFDAGWSEVTIQMRYKQMYDLITSSPGPDATNLLNLMNVKYLISIPQVKSTNYKLAHMNIPGGFGELEKEKSIKVYENLKVLPRAFLVGACYKVRSEEEYKDILTAKEFHPEQVALLDYSDAPEGFPCEKSAFMPAEPVKDAGEIAAITDYQNNSIELKVKLNSKKFLFLSESYYPGWEALVDGKPETIFRADYVFRALLLEPGEHKIRFQYNPLSFKIGAAITLVTMLICAIVLIRKKP